MCPLRRIGYWFLKPLNDYNDGFRFEFLDGKTQLLKSVQLSLGRLYYADD